MPQRLLEKLLFLFFFCKVDEEPQGNRRYNSNSRDIVASPSSFHASPPECPGEITRRLAKIKKKFVTHDNKSFNWWQKLFETLCPRQDFLRFTNTTFHQICGAAQRTLRKQETSLYWLKNNGEGSITFCFLYRTSFEDSVSRNVVANAVVLFVKVAAIFKTLKNWPVIENVSIKKKENCNPGLNLDLAPRPFIS